jgi:hypothetical protein
MKPSKLVPFGLEVIREIMVGESRRIQSILHVDAIDGAWVVEFLLKRHAALDAIARDVTKGLLHKIPIVISHGRAENAGEGRVLLARTPVALLFPAAGEVRLSAPLAVMTN